jgi:hypothetical protein
MFAAGIELAVRSENAIGISASEFYPNGVLQSGTFPPHTAVLKRVTRSATPTVKAQSIAA